MQAVVCKCGRRREIAGPLPGHPILSALFGVLDSVDLTACGWSRVGEGWRCFMCSHRRRVMRPIAGGKTCNVTEPRHRRAVSGNATTGPGGAILDPPPTPEEN
jgi:hypothetical protein